MKPQTTIQCIESPTPTRATDHALYALSRRSVRRIFEAAVLQLVAIALFASMASAQGNLMVLPGSTPRLVTQSQDLGPEDPGKQITVSILLKRHNEVAFRELEKELYTPGSSNYQRWLTSEQYAAMFGPSAAEASAVSAFLKSQNLYVTETDKYNQFVTARGRVADVERAFHVQIDRFSWNGKTYYANSTDAALEGSTGALTLAVLGLDNLEAESHARRPVDPRTGQPAQTSVNQVTPAGFTGNCWGAPEDDKFPLAGIYVYEYKGSKYTSTLNYATGICGYSPVQLQHAYGLDAVYTNGYNGTGQTVSIVVPYGSPTISQDLSTFDGYFSLPGTTLIITDSANIRGGNTGNSNLEATLDVESAHAFAPGAWIDLFVAKDFTVANLLLEESSAITNNCVTISGTKQCSYQISNSWGAPETAIPSTTLTAFNSLASTAAAMGISLNFSSGDDGDFQANTGTIQVSWPASDPSVTAVGGTSLFLKNNGSGDILFQTGWGNNLTQIVHSGTPSFPWFLGFQGGAGGGTSAFWAQPSWQAAYGLSGNRHVPDIAYLADGNTGALIIESYDQPAGYAAIFPVGGTSLATPMFSAVWAITNQWSIQNTGIGPSLGLAAGKLYTAGAPAITDIQHSSYSLEVPNDVSGTYCDTTTPFINCEIYPQGYLAGLGSLFWANPDFVSALYNTTASNNWYVLTFGTDSSLHTAAGWDNVTGLGTPNGWNFVTAFQVPQCAGNPPICW